MKAVLRGKGLWRLVSEQEKRTCQTPINKKNGMTKQTKPVGYSFSELNHLSEYSFKSSEMILLKFGQHLKLHTYKKGLGPDLTHTTISSQSEKTKLNLYKP